MSMGLHSAREELGLPNVASSHGVGIHPTSGYNLHTDVGHHHQQQQQQHHHHQQQQQQHNSSLSKPMSLSPRTFGMEDLRDFCGPVGGGTFKTGLTPRVFSTGLTPRSGFTPRFATGFTPRINVTDLSQACSNAPSTGTVAAATSFMSRPSSTGAGSGGGGFSPRTASDAPHAHSKISPSGFTPKDVSGLSKVPMRFPGAFSSSSSPKMAMVDQYKQEQQQQQPQHSHLSHIQRGSLSQSHLQQMQQLHHQSQQMSHHPGQMTHPSMAAMNMNMYEYMHRPTLQQQQHSVDARLSGTPCSDRASDQEDLDERRRMKNRERVRKCRKRKQDRLNFLEDRTAELEKENGLLKAKVARKASGVKDHEPLTDVQLDELRKSQTTTLLAYIRAYNEAAEGATFDMSACSIWTDNAEILYGSSGTSVAGLAGIVACKKSSSSVFAKYEIKQYMVQWKPNSTDKCLVNWDIEVIVKQDAAKDVPLTAPFAALAPHFGATGELLTFQMTSHITFEDVKIVEEIRQLNLSRISEKALEQFGDDPKKAADVLRSLMNTA